MKWVVVNAKLTALGKQRDETLVGHVVVRSDGLNCTAHGTLDNGMVLSSSMSWQIR